MSRKRFTPEPIIGKLREAEAAFAHRAPGRQQPAGLGGMEAEKALSQLPIENLPGWVRQGPAFFVPPQILIVRTRVARGARPHALPEPSVAARIFYPNQPTMGPGDKFDYWNVSCQLRRLPSEIEKFKI